MNPTRAFSILFTLPLLALTTTAAPTLPGVGDASKIREAFQGTAAKALGFE